VSEHYLQTGPDSPPAWWARFRRVAARAHELGRLPRRSDGGDLTDVSWLADQRRASALTPAQLRALETLPGWFEGTRDGRWVLRADELRSFVLANGRLPRKRSDDPREPALYDWHRRQEKAHTHGQLAHHRVTALAYALRALRATNQRDER